MILWHLSLSVRGRDGGGGKLWDTNIPPSPPPTPHPLKFSPKISCCQIFFLGNSVLCKVSEYISFFLHSDGPLWHNLSFCDFRFKYLANLYYVSTTDILSSTFSFESVNFFSHFYRALPPPTTTPDIQVMSMILWHLSLSVRGGMVVGGGMWHKHPPHHHHPTSQKFSPKVSCCQNFFWETQFCVRFQNI